MAFGWKRKGVTIPYMGLIHSTEDPKDKKVAKGPVHSLCLN